MRGGDWIQGADTGSLLLRPEEQEHSIPETEEDTEMGRGLVERTHTHSSLGLTTPYNHTSRRFPSHVFAEYLGKESIPQE